MIDPDKTLRITEESFDLHLKAAEHVGFQKAVDALKQHTGIALQMGEWLENNKQEILT